MTNSKMSIERLICSSGVLLFALIVSVLHESLAFSISKNNFAFHSQIIVTGRDHSRRVSRIGAIYSSDQGRAKLSVSDESAIEHSRYYHDHLGTIYRPVSGDCIQLSNQNDLEYMLFGFEFPIEHKRQDDDKQSWLVGVARLLHFLEQQDTNMVLTNNTDWWHETAAIKYELRYRLPQTGQETLFEVYYSKLNLISAPDSQPVGVIFNLTSDQMVAIELSQMRLLTSMYSSQSSKLDLFALDANICTDATELFRSARLVSIDSLLPGTHRFTFQFETKGWIGKVLFDPNLKLLLTKQHQRFKSTDQTWQLVDFNTNRAYMSAISHERCRAFDVASINSSASLIGAYESLTLGRAQLRGFETIVYLAKLHVLPPWLELTLNDTAQTKEFWMLLYQVDCSQASCPLVLLELVNMDTYKQTGDLDRSIRTRIEIYNFVSESGLSEFKRNAFSLQKLCSSNEMKDNPDEANIELILTSLTDFDAKTLLEPKDHNLIASFQQDLLLSPLEITALKVGQVSRNKLLVDFKIFIKHPEVEIKIDWLGQSDLTSHEAFNEFRVWPEANFRQCLASVVFRQVEIVHFGYDQVRGHCYTPKNSKSSADIDFHLDETKSISIYRITSDLLPPKIDTRKVNLAYYLNKHLTLKRERHNKSIESVEFIVQQVSVSPFGQSQILERISGFSFIEGQQNSTTRFKPSEGQPTLSQCRAVCLNEFSCKSYSYCQRDTADFRCLHSSNDFRPPEVQEQLKNLINETNGRQISRQVTVNLTTSPFQVELEQNLRCELHTKCYLSLFGQGEQVDGSQYSHLSQIVEVASGEQCAEICFDHNLDFLRVDEQLLSRFVSNATTDGAGDLDDLLYRYQVERRKQRSAQICSDFLYSSVNTKNNSGQCYFASSMNLSRSRSSESDKSRPSPTMVGLWRYKFNPLSLFEQRPQVQLQGSVMDLAVARAYEALKAGKNITDDKLAIEALRLFLKASGNFQQKLLVLDESLCAQACFAQSSGLWPACRSFDVVVAGRNRELGAGITCLLNSISLGQAIAANRSDAIGLRAQEAQELGALSVHYEPLGGDTYAISEANFDEIIKPASDGADNNNKSGWNKLMALLFVLASALGLFAGKQMSLRISGNNTGLRPREMDRGDDWAQSGKTLGLSDNVDEQDVGDAEDELELLSVNLEQSSIGSFHRARTWSE